MASEIWRSDADAKGEVTHLVPGPPYTEASVADALLCVCDARLGTRAKRLGTFRAVPPHCHRALADAKQGFARQISLASLLASLTAPDFASLTAREIRDASRGVRERSFVRSFTKKPQLQVHTLILLLLRARLFHHPITRHEPLRT